MFLGVREKFLSSHFVLHKEWKMLCKDVYTSVVRSLGAPTASTWPRSEAHETWCRTAGRYRSPRFTMTLPPTTESEDWFGPPNYCSTSSLSWGYLVYSCDAIFVIHLSWVVTVRSFNVVGVFDPRVEVEIQIDPTVLLYSKSFVSGFFKKNLNLWQKKEGGKFPEIFYYVPFVHYRC